MGLLTDLRELAGKIDASLLPTANEAPAVLGALVYRVEHGADALAELVGKDAQEVSDYIAEHESGAAPNEPAQQDPTTPWPPSTQNTEGPGQVPTPLSTPTTTPAVDAPAGAPIVAPDAPATLTPAAPAAPADDGPTPAELRAEISDLKAQLAARNATANATVVDHGEGASSTATPPTTVPAIPDPDAPQVV
jgi:hypothetical protein